MKLELRGVTKRYGDQVVLADVSLAVDEIRALAVFGPSGGGKSTLLRIIAGLETPDAGEVRLNERTLRFEENHLLEHRRRIGTVFQTWNLFPHLNALENITLPLEKVHRAQPAVARERALTLLQRFGLEPHAEKKPAHLSGGQRQRVALARAISIRPELVLLDEPTSALDPAMTAEVLGMIEELREEKVQFILVTHEMGFARHVADRVAFLAGGKIEEFGTASEVFENASSRSCREFLASVLRY